MDEGNSGALIVIFLIWGALWAWLLARRSWKVTMRQLFVLVTSFAAISALTVPPGQDFLRVYADQVALVVVAVFVLDVSVLLVLAGLGYR